jgi:hypothetical protein
MCVNDVRDLMMTAEELLAEPMTDVKVLLQCQARHLKEPCCGSAFTIVASYLKTPNNPSKIRPFSFGFQMFFLFGFIVSVSFLKSFAFITKEK